MCCQHWRSRETEKFHELPVPSGTDSTVNSEVYLFSKIFEVELMKTKDIAINADY
jgi:hypothetical protein